MNTTQRPALKKIQTTFLVLLGTLEQNAKNKSKLRLVFIYIWLISFKIHSLIGSH